MYIQQLLKLFLFDNYGIIKKIPTPCNQPVNSAQFAAQTDFFITNFKLLYFTPDSVVQCSRRVKLIFNCTLIRLYWTLASEHRNDYPENFSG